MYAFLLYSLTLCRGPHPGFFSSLLAEHAGLTFKPPVLHPVWTVAVRLFRWLPIGSLAFWANMFNAFLGAVSVRLITLIICDIPHDRAAEESRFSAKDSDTGLIAGLASGFLLATCIPLWVLSTRSHPLLLGVTWMLFLIRAVQLQWRSLSTKGQWIIALFTGLGASEYAGLLVASPLFMISGLLLALRTKKLLIHRPGSEKGIHYLWIWVARWLGMYALGLLPYVFTAFIIHQSDAYRWFAQPTWLSIVRFAVSSQISSVVSGIPRLGWIVIAFSTFGVLFVILFKKKAETREQVGGSMFMHAVMTGVLILVFLDWKISPWRLTRMNPLLLSPYIASAGALGYLVGYWRRVLSGKRRKSNRMEPLIHSVFVAAVFLFSALFTFRNYSVCNAANLTIVHKYVVSVIDSLRDGQWLLSDGLLDSVLEIEAHEQRREVRIIHPKYETQKPYLKYLREQFDNDRLRAMAEISISTLIDEWISKYDGADYVATLGNPEFWMRYDYGLHFRGPIMVASESHADTSEEQQAFLDAFLTHAGDLPENGLSTAWREYICQRLSRQANNYGFSMQMEGHHNISESFYITAVSFNTNNISAWLNRLYLCRRTACGQEQKLKEEVKRAREHKSGMRNIWHLSRYDGFVFSSEAFLQRGMSRAASENPRNGLREFERATDINREDPRAQVLMNALRMRLGDYNTSRENYLEIIKSDPENRQALLMLARISMMQGDFDTAEGFLNKLNQLEFDPVSLDLEYGILYLMSGEFEKAYHRLDNIIKRGKSDLRVYIVMALLGLEMNDREMVERSVDEIRQSNVAGIPEIFLLLGRAALFMDEIREAQRLFKAASKFSNYREQSLQALLGIAVAENLTVDLKEQAEDLLRINPDNYYANFIMGLIHTQREQYALALSYLYVAVEQKKNADIVNTLAYALARSNKNEDALMFAREAVDLDPSNGHAWDTLAMAQMNLDLWDQAHESLNRALLLLPDHPEIIYHMARVKEYRGLNEEALNLIETLSDKLSLLSPATIEEIRQMRIRLTH